MLVAVTLVREEINNAEYFDPKDVAQIRGSRARLYLLDRVRGLEILEYDVQ